MAKFITRIELHEADSSDYDTLHEEMKNEGFDKTIKNYKNIKFHLLDSEYYYVGHVEIEKDEYDYEAVLKKAVRAASKTNKSFRAITSRTDASKWYNLEQVK